MNQFYTQYPQFSFSSYAIKKLVDFSNKRKEYVVPIMDQLLLLLKSNRSSLVSETVIVLRQILQMHAQVKNNENSVDLLSLVSRLILLYENLSDSRAKESLIWIATEYYDCLTGLAPDMLRLAAKTFSVEVI
ncbi:AP-3 complex subunit beta-2 [Thelohanellus kitauei]|uniref:AP-3 complex subunit beta-2 n=1 Tax=Thelohanellus kitauei TaxID=669202 RepID=A0A0C2MVU1_THEKT|nr:AP-3 complex subunit beta-2 [Thelohanellus kitauei]